MIISEFLPRFFKNEVVICPYDHSKEEITHEKRNAVIPVSALALVLCLNLSACEQKPAASSVPEELSTVMLEATPEPTPESTPESLSESASESASTAAADTNAASSSDELDGRVEQIGADFVIVSKIFTEELADGTMLAVAPGVNAPDSDKTLITVTFTDSTSFIIRTVENGGVKASDVSNAPAAKDDLKDGMSVFIKGSQTESEFLASEIVIYNYR